MRGIVRYLNRMRLGQQAVYLEYPYDLQRRWGGSGNPYIARSIEASKATIESNVAALSAYAADLKLIADRARIPFDNHQLPVLDGLTVMWGARHAKGTYMEVGSGYSTMYARAALGDGAATRIVSIDPQPREEVDAICDEVVRAPLESVDLSVFDRLEAGDTLFFDGSHRSLQNSDVTVFMLDVLPRLKSGVCVGIHDIMLPFDYPAAWRERTYNEQYLLGCFLVANPGYFDLQFCNHWLWASELHIDPLREIWSIVGDKARDRAPSAFWAIKN